MKDDPTIRKVVGFSKRWGYDGIIMVNVFALVSTDPKELRRVADPVGQLNHETILEGARTAKDIIVAFGNPPFERKAYEIVDLLLLLPGGREIFCIGRTKAGWPMHPSRVGYTERPLVFL